MTDICLPIDASAGSPSFPAAQHRVAQSALIMGRSDRPLGAHSGVRPGSEPTITATSTTWTVTPFAAVVDPETALTVGPYLVAFTANKTGAVNAADATNPRIDRLDLQVPDDPSGGTTTPVIVYTAGVAAASPSAPAAPARSTPLAQITVPKAGTGSPSVAVTYKHTASAGGIIIATDSTQYPAHPFKGQMVYDVARDRLMRYSGTAWSPVGAGFYVGEQALVTAVTLATTSAFASSAKVTFALTEQRRVKITGTVGRYSPATTGNLRIQAGYNSGASATIGSFVGVGAIVNTTSSGNANGALAVGSALLAAGTYTAYISLSRVGGSATDTADNFSVLVEDLGAV